MSASNQLAVWLPFVLALLLVGAAVLGSRLEAAARRKVQRFILLPLFVLVMAGGLWLAVAQHEFLRAGILFLMVMLILPRLFARVRATQEQGS